MSACSCFISDTICETSKLQAAGRVLRITGFLDFVHCPEFWIPEHAPFRKLDPFLFSGEGRETPTLVGPLERANLDWANDWSWLFLRDMSTCLLPITWGWKHIQFPKLCFLVFRIPDDGQSPETQQLWVLYTIVRTFYILQGECCLLLGQFPLYALKTETIHSF
jgi:hypothetical protein